VTLREDFNREMRNLSEELCHTMLPIIQKASMILSEENHHTGSLSLDFSKKHVQ
jgi:hypothetical protein